MKHIKTKVISALLCLALVGIGFFGLFGGDNTRASAAAGDYGAMRFVSIDSGVEHTVAVTIDGDVYGWGRNTYGQLGYNNPALNIDENQPRLLIKSSEFRSLTGISSGDIFVKVACTEYTTALLTQGGEIFFAGSNYYNEMGILRGITTGSSQVGGTTSTKTWIRYNYGVLDVSTNRYSAKDVFAGAINFVIKLSDGTYNGGHSQVPANAYITTGLATFMLGSESNGSNGLFESGVKFQYSYDDNPPKYGHMSIADVPIGSFGTQYSSFANLAYSGENLVYSNNALFFLEASSQAVGDATDELAVGGTAMYFVSNNTPYVKTKGKLSYSLDNILGTNGALNTFQDTSSTDDVRKDLVYAQSASVSNVGPVNTLYISTNNPLQVSQSSYLKYSYKIKNNLNDYMAGISSGDREIAVSKIFASENFGYSLDASTGGFYAWGNNAQGQVNPTSVSAGGNTQSNEAPTLITPINTGSAVLTMAAGKVAHVNYATPKYNATKDLPHEIANYKTRDDIITAENSANFVSAYLDDSNDVYVWGNVDKTNGIKSTDGYTKLSIEGNAKIVALFASYGKLYMLSEFGKIYYYDGTDSFNATMKKAFYDQNGDLISDLIIEDATPRQLTFSALGAVASVSLLDGVSGNNVGGTSNQPFVASQYNNAVRFIIPNEDVRGNGGVRAVPNWLPSEYGDSSIAVSHAIAPEYQAFDSHTATTNTLKFQMYTTAGALATSYGTGGDITHLITNYLSFNYFYENATGGGHNILLNFKSLMRTPVGHKIRATIPIGVYNSYFRELDNGNIFYDESVVYIDIIVNNTGSELRSLQDINIVSDTNGYEAAVVDANNPAFNNYSWAVMDVSNGFNKLAEYLGADQTAQDAIKAELINLAGQDLGFRGKYNYLINDLDGDRVMLDPIFFDANGKLYAANNVNSTYYDIYKRVITISMLVDTQVASLDLFRNFYGFYNVSFVTEGMQKRITFSYDVLNAVAKTSTIDELSNEFRAFNIDLYELPLRDNVNTVGNLKHIIMAGDTNGVRVKVDSTIYFKNDTIQNTKVVNYEGSTALAYRSTLTMAVGDFFNDTSLIGFYAEGLDSAAFVASFDPDLIEVTEFNPSLVTFRALNNFGVVTFTIHVRRGGVQIDETFYDNQAPITLTVNITLTNTSANTKFSRLPSQEIGIEDTTIRSSKTVDITKYFRGLENGIRISVVAISISNPSILTAEFNNRENAVSTVTFNPVGAGTVTVVFTVKEFGLSLVENFTFVVVGTATFSEDTLKVNGRVERAVEDLKQSLISTHRLGTSTALAFKSLSYFKVENGVEVELTEEEAAEIISVVVQGEWVYYVPAPGANALLSSMVNVVFTFTDLASNEYRIRQRVEIAQFIISPDATIEGHAVFFFDIREASEDSFSITAAQLAKYGLPTYSDVASSKYEIQNVTRANGSENNRVVDWESNRGSVKFIPQRSGEQQMSALVSYNAAGSYTYYTIIFTVYVDGIKTTLTQKAYQNNIWLAAGLVFLTMFIIFVVRVSIYGKKLAEQRAIVKKNRQLIKARESLHNRGSVMSRKEMVQAKLKYNDPKYARMLHDIKAQKMGGNAGAEDGGKKKKKNNKKKSIEELKAELAQKKAQAAAMLNNDQVFGEEMEMEQPMNDQMNFDGAQGFDANQEGFGFDANQEAGE